LHYHGLRLSRSFFPLDSAARLALGLCFCEHCTRAAAGDGVDAERVAGWARQTAGRAFAGEAVASDRPLALEELADAAGGELLAYLRLRSRVVTGLASSIADVTGAAGVALCFMDQAAAEPAVLGPGVLDEAFRAGVDPATLGPVCEEYQVLGYRDSAAAVAADLAGYHRALGPGTAVRLALRPEPPDSRSVEDLEAKLRAGVESGVSGFDFYHYGLVSDAALARVAAALERVFGRLA
jgi:hypothetical protein